MTNPTQLPAWKALAANRDQIAKTTLKELFAADPARGERLTAEACGLYLDYSKNRITDDTLKLLVRLAEETGVRLKIDAMFRGDKINVTENRAVLHVALRAPRGASIRGGSTTSASEARPTCAMIRAASWPRSARPSGGGASR